MTSLAFSSMVVGNLTSVLVFIFPMKKFQNMLTGDEAAMPIIASMLSVISWTVHGVVTKNPWIVTTNIVGLCVHVFYLIIIFKYRQHYQFQFTFSTFTACMALLAMYAMLYPWYAYMTHSDYLSLEPVVFPLAMVRSIYPVVTTNNAITTRNLESVELPMCLLTIVNGGVWFVRGLVKSDFFIMVPNGLTFLIALVQLIAYARLHPHRE